MLPQSIRNRRRDHKKSLSIRSISYIFLDFRPDERPPTCIYDKQHEDFQIDLYYLETFETELVLAIYCAY